MTEEEALEEALKIVPKYPGFGQCGCGEGWQNEQCTKLEQLIGDGECHCIYDYMELNLQIKRI